MGKAYGNLAYHPFWSVLDRYVDKLDKHKCFFFQLVESSQSLVDYVKKEYEGARSSGSWFTLGLVVLIYSDNLKKQFKAFKYLQSSGVSFYSNLDMAISNSSHSYVLIF